MDVQFFWKQQMTLVSPFQNGMMEHAEVLVADVKSQFWIFDDIWPPMPDLCSVVAFLTARNSWSPTPTVTAETESFKSEAGGFRKLAHVVLGQQGRDQVWLELDMGMMAYGHWVNIVIICYIKYLINIIYIYIYTSTWSVVLSSAKLFTAPDGDEVITSFEVSPSSEVWRRPKIFISCSLTQRQNWYMLRMDMHLYWSIWYE